MQGIARDAPRDLGANWQPILGTCLVQSAIGCRSHARPRPLAQHRERRTRIGGRSRALRDTSGRVNSGRIEVDMRVPLRGYLKTSVPIELSFRSDARQNPPLKECRWRLARVPAQAPTESGCESAMLPLPAIVVTTGNVQRFGERGELCPRFRG